VEGGKRMRKEEAVATAISAAENAWLTGEDNIGDGYIALSRAAIVAADKWDAEQGKGRTEQDWNTLQSCYDTAMAEVASLRARFNSRPASAISPGLDSVIQEELDHPPASIMEKGK
jgi:hypothetical protein